MEFSRPPQLSEGTKEKTKTRRQTHEKEHNKQVRFHWTGKVLKTWIWFHSTLTRKCYLKGIKIDQIGRYELDLF